MAVPLRRPTLMGLPSSPAPRSRSVTAGMVTHDIPQRPSSAASHRYAPSSHSNSSHPSFPSTLRTQRSLVNLSNTMQQSNYIPPVPPVPPKERRRIARVPPPSLIVDDSSMFQTSPIRKESVSSISSASSTTSGTSASSLFSARSLGSAISSATSVGDEEEMKAEEVKPSIAEGFGSSLWNRVANAAGSLTISVSKAWEANVATYMGESTFTNTCQRCPNLISPFVYFPTEPNYM